MLIRRRMTRDVVTVPPTATVADALELLNAHGIRHLPVVELLGGRERHTRIELLAPDRPGELARVVRLIGVEHEVNITGVVVPPPKSGRAMVVLHVEAADPTPVLEDLRRLGYEAASPTLEDPAE